MAKEHPTTDPSAKMVCQGYYASTCDRSTQKVSADYNVWEATKASITIACPKDV